MIGPDGPVRVILVVSLHGLIPGHRDDRVDLHLGGAVGREKRSHQRIAPVGNGRINGLCSTAVGCYQQGAIGDAGITIGGCFYIQPGIIAPGKFVFQEDPFLEIKGDPPGVRIYTRHENFSRIPTAQFGMIANNVDFTLGVVWNINDEGNGYLPGNWERGDLVGES